jgi:peptidyl-prolyl cis-trans isomerase A (cyclophilin A)
MKQVLILVVLFSCVFLIADEPAKNTNPLVIIKTSMGDIVVELFADSAPKTTANFIGLAEGTVEYKDAKTGEKKKGNFYDGLNFHRVIKNFMIQGGCPLGTGTGGPGYTIYDEINGYIFGFEKQPVSLTPDLMQQLAIKKTFADFKLFTVEEQKKYEIEPFTKKLGENVTYLKEKQMSFTKLDLNLCLGYTYDKNLKTRKLVKGSIAMANSGPNTNGSQFFINVADTPHLDGTFTNFGQVVKGMDVAMAISVTPTVNSRPNEEVKIISIRKLSDKEKEEVLSSK